MRPRFAATLAFVTNGAMMGSLLPRYPLIKSELGLTTAQFGLVVIAVAAGGVLAAHLPAVLTRRFGTRGVVTWGTALMGLGLTIAALGVEVSLVWLFVAAMVAFGFLDAVVDVAQNSQGLTVQDALGKSVLTTMHAGWSLGTATGGALGALAAVAEVPLVLHIAVASLLWVVLAGLAARSFRPDPPEAAGTKSDHAPVSWGRLLVWLSPLFVIAMAGFAVEDVGNNWVAVFLAGERSAPIGVAGLGVPVVLGAQFAGRVFGDACIDAVGESRALGLGLLLVVSGMTVGIWTPAVWMSLLGFGLAGLGSAVTIPLSYARANRLPGTRPQTGLAVLSWFMRGGGLALSPVIGVLGQTLGLKVGLSLAVVLAGLGLLATRFAPGTRGMRIRR